MNAGRPVSFKFVSNEMATNGANIRKWAAQNDNLLLKTLALEVLEVAGVKI